MVRGPTIDKNGMKKGAWNEEEDNKLRSYIQRYGIWNWRQMPKFAGLNRCGKSCRLRWMNYLRPGVRRGNYTPQEEELILQLHKEHGNKWSVIKSSLPGRTDNDIKNHWNAHLSKKTTIKQVQYSNPIYEYDSSYHTEGSSSISTVHSMQQTWVQMEAKHHSKIFANVDQTNYKEEAIGSEDCGLAEGSMSSMESIMRILNDENCFLPQPLPMPTTNETSYNNYHEQVFPSGGGEVIIPTYNNAFDLGEMISMDYTLPPLI